MTTEAQSSSSQCSVRVLNIKETGKTRGLLISGGAYTGCIFCSQVDGPITGGGGACKRLGL